MTESRTELIENCPGKSSKDLTEPPIESISYYKLFVKDLQACKECAETAEGGKVFWNLDIGNNKSLTVKFVWIQGDIVDVQEDFILLKDSTGSCRVTINNAIPGFKAWLVPGVYCSVLGQLQAVGVEPTVFAMRLNNASSNAVLRQMWPDEVDELKEVLNNRIFPSLKGASEKQSADEQEPRV